MSFNNPFFSSGNSSSNAAMAPASAFNTAQMPPAFPAAANLATPFGQISNPPNDPFAAPPNPSSNSTNPTQPATSLFNNAAQPATSPFNNPASRTNSFGAGLSAPNNPFAVAASAPMFPPTPSFPFSAPANTTTPPQPFAPQPASTLSPSMPDPFAPRAAAANASAKAPQGDPFQQPMPSSSGFASSTAHAQPSMADVFKAAPQSFQTGAKGDPFQPPPENQSASWSRDHRDTREIRDVNSARNSLFLKGVPDELFDRDVLTAFFSATTPPANVTNISLRGKNEAHRRTARISFTTEADAVRCLDQCTHFKGARLQLSYFRPAGSRVEQERNSAMVEATSELVFTSIPEALFTEQKIRNMFNTVVPNSVAGVSIRSRSYNGDMRRTAIIRFNSIDNAAATLNALPSKYHDEALKIHFRQRPPNAKPPVAPMEPRAAHEPYQGMAPGLSATHAKEFVHDDVAQSSMFGSDSHMSYENPRSVDDAEMDVAAGTRTFAIPDDDEGDGVEPLAPQAQEDDAKREAEEKMREMEELRRRIQERTEEIERKKANERRKARELKREGERKREIQREKESERERASNRHSDAKSMQKLMRQKTFEIPKKNVSGLSEQLDKEWRKHEKINISDAVAPLGICQQMCSDSEIEDRIIQKAFDDFEKTNGEPDPAKAVKKYSRSSAGDTKQVPSELRPAPVLLRTMEHLKRICDSSDDYKHVYDFVRDRARALRQDIACQHIRDEVAIRIIEECSRFLIHSAHRLCELPEEQFTSKQNLEQIDNCLLTLRELYDNRREDGLPTSPNEPEMQAYYLLVHMSESRKCMELYSQYASDVQRSEPVQFAFKVREAASDMLFNPGIYFKCVRDSPYLAACIMHMRFTDFRSTALRLMNDTYGAPKQEDKLPIAFLTHRFCFENDEETLEFCAELGFQTVQTAEGYGATEYPMSHIRTPCTTLKRSTVKWKSRRSVNVIESKLGGIKLSQIVSGEGPAAWAPQQLDCPLTGKKATKTRSNFYPKMRITAKAAPVAAKAPTKEETKPETPSPVQRETPKLPTLGGNVPVVLNSERQVTVAKEAEPFSGFFPVGKRPHESVAEVQPASGPFPQKPKVSLFNPFTTPVPPVTSNAAMSMTGHPVANPPFSFAATPGWPSNPRETPMINKRKRPAEPANDETVATKVDEGLTSSPAKKANRIFPQGSIVGGLVTAAPSAPHAVPAAVPGDTPQPSFGLRSNDQTPSFSEKPPAHIPVADSSLSPSTPALNLVGPVQMSAVAREAGEAPQSTKTSDKINEQSQVIDQPALPAPAVGVAKEVRNPKAARDRQQTIEFIGELDKCLDGVDALVKKMRGRRLVTEELYSLEHQECLKALDDLKTIGDIAESARKRAFETDCACQWVESDLTALTISALVPPLRRASLLWDDIWAFLLQAESQLRRVSLVVRRKRGGGTESEKGIEYSYAMKRKNEKPLRFTEIDEATPRAARKFGVGVRSRPQLLTELTDVSCRLLGNNIRRWQAAVIPLSGTGSESNRWVQKRLRGWWNSEGGEFKSLELDDNGIDRYVSVVSCAEGGVVPETANVIVGSIDVGREAAEICASLKNLEEVLLSVKKRGVALGLAIPAVVVVAVENEVSNVNCFSLEVAAVQKKFLSSGLASMVKVVRPSEGVIRKLGMDVTLRDALLRSVDLASIWERSEGLMLEAVTLKEVLLMRGSVAWKKVLVNSRSFEDINARNTNILEAINEAWSNVARDMLLQECRWPVEVVGRREEVRKLREQVEEYAKLPSPGDLGVSSTAEYVAQLAIEAGMKPPEIDYAKATHPLWQFCLSLREVIPALLQTRLGQSWDQVFLLPKEKQSLDDFKRKQDILTRFFNSDRTRVGVVLAEKSRRRSQFDMVGGERQAESADRLDKRRKVESGQSGTTRRLTFSMYEALVREGEAYTRVLDATMEEIRTRAATENSAAGFRWQRLHHSL